jgi:hypothetical protein
MDTLQANSEPVSIATLQRHYELEIWDPDSEPDFDFWNTPARRHSIRMSMGRALRQLEATGQIKRDKVGDWYPAKDWTARDTVKRERSATAYHEAGHAVIGLALQLPVAFVTIKPRASYPGHVSYAPKHHSVGAVYPRGSYRKPIADMSEQDAFGNPVIERNDDWHARAVMSIAGGMAEAEFLKDGYTWRKQASSSDKHNVAFYRRKLGDNARSVEEYEAECEKLVKQHWPMIEAVAVKLLKEETLSGNDVYAICWRIARNVVRRQHLKDKPRR